MSKAELKQYVIDNWQDGMQFNLFELVHMVETDQITSQFELQAKMVIL